MRADYLRPWMDLLRARLEPGERILARGRAFQPHRDSFELSQLISGPGCALVVTDRRVLWVSRSDQRWVRMLPFAAVRSYVELTQAHRYVLVLEHDGMERWQWVPAHRFLLLVMGQRRGPPVGQTECARVQPSRHCRGGSDQDPAPGGRGPGQRAPIATQAQRRGEVPDRVLRA